MIQIDNYHAVSHRNVSTLSKASLLKQAELNKTFKADLKCLMTYSVKVLYHTSVIWGTPFDSGSKESLTGSLPRFINKDKALKLQLFFSSHFSIYCPSLLSLFSTRDRNILKYILQFILAQI